MLISVNLLFAVASVLLSPGMSLKWSLSAAGVHVGGPERGPAARLWETNLAAASYIDVIKEAMFLFRGESFMYWRKWRVAL